MKRIGGILAATILGCTGSLMFTQPAQAAEIFDQVCNSSASVDAIIVKLAAGGHSVWLYPGGCWNNVPTDGTRVDVDPAGSGPDVDSYKIGIIGEGYGPCHVGETNSSDPPNAGSGVRYRTYTNSSCS